MRAIMPNIINILALAAAICPFAATAQDYFVPSSGKGLVVVLISGVSGTALYKDYAEAIAGLGYTAVLVSGKEVGIKDERSGINLKNLIQATQSDPRVVPGKVGVVGFSLGGGGALLHAASQRDTVAFVVAYYPSVTNMPSIAEAGRSVSVPTLILAGAKDRYNHCCLVESMHEFQSASKNGASPVELVVYPNADHGFNLKVPAYRSDDAADAWARVKTMLAKYAPV